MEVTCMDGVGTKSGQVGTGLISDEDGSTTKLVFTPALVKTSLHDSFVLVRTGSRHSAALSTDQHLYTWGWNGYGQLCHNDQTDRVTPSRVKFFAANNLSILDVICEGWFTLVKVRKS